MAKSNKKSEEVKSEFATPESEAIHNEETKMVWVKFTYIEQPGQKMTCSPSYTPIDKATGKRAGKNIYFEFEALDGELIEWPQWFVNNLNNLTVPEPYNVKGRGGLVTTGVRQRNRFSCVPVAAPMKEQLLATG